MQKGLKPLKCLKIISLGLMLVSLTVWASYRRASRSLPVLAANSSPQESSVEVPQPFSEPPPREEKELKKEQPKAPPADQKKEKASIPEQELQRAEQEWTEPDEEL